MKSIVTITYCHPIKKIEILCKNITELRKGDFEEVTTGQLNANIIGLSSSTTDEDTVWIDDKTVEQFLLTHLIYPH